jgi:hypothetical protein
MEVFFKDKRIKFHGIIRDHDNTSYFKKNKYDVLVSKFTLYVGGRTNIAPRSKELFKLMVGDVNVISDEDFVTTDNISVENKVSRIKNIFPSAKIIIVVRSPVSLLNSFYYFFFRTGHIKVGINDWLDKELLNYEKSIILQTAHYERCISSFIKNFGKTNVHILNFEDLKYNSNAFLLSLYEIMGLKYLKKEKRTKKRNEALPESAVQFGVKNPLVWNIRSYAPQFIRRIVKYFFSKIKVRSGGFNSANIEKINKLYMDDIKYLKNEFNIVFKDV